MSKTYNFKATIDKILFRNEENDYTIAKFQTKDQIPAAVFNNLNATFFGTMVGKTIPIVEGDVVVVETEVVNNGKWGEQHQIISLKKDLPKTEDELQVFLEALMSPSRAKQIVKYYPNILDLLKENPNFEPNYKLLQGIGKPTWEKLKTKILDNTCYAELFELLAPIGVTSEMIKKISTLSNNVALLKQKIIENPYQTLCQLPNVGFKKVDNYARHLNPQLIHSKQRAEEAIKYILTQASEMEGHCYLTNKEFIDRFKELVPECMSVVKELIIEQRDLKEKSWLYLENDKVGLRRFYNLERKILENLLVIKNRKNYWNISYKDFFDRLEKLAKKQGFQLDESQLDAVKSIADNNITIIAGKAGAGKTSILKAILEVYKDKSISMCALSAKAAKRIRETSGFLGACTIHKLLGLGVQEEEVIPITTDLLIIDEVSMVNSYLLNLCLNACSPITKVILVGDKAQLPSIGIGRVLGDLLDYPDLFNVHILSKIYRQSEDSFISHHANIIRDGRLPFSIDQSKLFFGKDTKYFFKKDSEVIVDMIVQTYLAALKQGKSFEDVAIIIPRKEKTTLSCSKINNTIMNILIPDDVPQIKTESGKIFKKGCRVLNKVNDYDKSVLNGDTGIVSSIFKDERNVETALIKFDDYDDLKPFTKSELNNNVELGYAITCHSSQGSQYDTCIFGLDFGSFSMLSANLIYTAITRAKNNLLVFAEPNAFVKAVLNTKEDERHTFLSCFLKEISEKS